MMRAALFPLVVLLVASSGPVAAADTLARSKDVYAALQSYADTGTIDVEYGHDSRDRHTFATQFTRAPRGFKLDFHKQSGDQVVIWGDPDAFHSWWKTTGQTQDFPNPNNVGVFVLAAPMTADASAYIPPLLYSKATLPSLFTNLTTTGSEESEVLDGRACARITGTAHDVYGTGHETNVRTVVLWIDAESLLIRKIVEERTALPGQRNRVTTTFEPRANPSLNPEQFRFRPSP